MIRRQLSVKIFLGSTTEEIEASVQSFCAEQRMCPGNLVDSTLYKLDSVYQLVLWYAVVVEDDND